MASTLASTTAGCRFATAVPEEVMTTTGRFVAFPMPKATKPALGGGGGEGVLESLWLELSQLVDSFSPSLVHDAYGVDLLFRGGPGNGYGEGGTPRTGTDDEVRHAAAFELLHHTLGPRDVDVGVRGGVVGGVEGRFEALHFDAGLVPFTQRSATVHDAGSSVKGHGGGGRGRVSLDQCGTYRNGNFRRIGGDVTERTGVKAPIEFFSASDFFCCFGSGLRLGVGGEEEGGQMELRGDENDDELSVSVSPLRRRLGSDEASRSTPVPA